MKSGFTRDPKRKGERSGLRRRKEERGEKKKKKKRECKWKINERAVGALLKAEWIGCETRASAAMRER